MPRIPIILAVLIVLAAAAGILVIVLSPGISMTDAETAQTITGIAATAGALVSASFVIPAYLQNLRAFAEAHRPQLLVQVTNEHKNVPGLNLPVPVTILHYRNITSKQFSNLTLRLMIEGYGRHVDLSDIFTRGMTMPGFDQRLKKFEPVTLANEKGLYLNTQVTGQPNPELAIEYEYRYLGRLWQVKAQQYVWNPEEQIWEIK